jgi:hypothetical protein
LVNLRTLICFTGFYWSWNTKHQVTTIWKVKHKKRSDCIAEVVV